MDMEVDEYDIRNEEAEVTTEDHLDAVMSRTCDVFHVGYVSLSNEPQALSRLERTIEGALSENISLHEKYTDTAYEVKITVLNDVKQNNNDGVALKLETFRKNSVRNEHGESTMNRKSLGQCLFTSSNSTGKGIKYISKERKKRVQNLPVVIWHGTSAHWTTMRPILESNLKCTFSPVNLSKVDMQMFAGIWCIQELRRKASHVNQKLLLTYQFARDPVEFTCIIKLHPWRERLIELGEMAENEKDLKKGLSVLWRDINKEHERKSGIDIGRSVFKRIATKNCVVGVGGKIKLKKKSNLDEISHILKHFTQIVERK